MDIYFLDEEVLTVHSNILSYTNKIIIPDIAIRHLERFDGNNHKTIINIINNENNIEVGKTYKKMFDRPPNFPKLTLDQVMIVELIKEYNATLIEEQAFLITQNEELKKYSETIGIATLDFNELKKRNECAEKKEWINKKIEKSKKEKSFFISIIIGGIINLIVKLIYDNLPLIVEYVNKWVIIVLIPIMGVLLYFLRSKCRLIYGITEFIFGICNTLAVFLPKFDIISIYNEVDTVKMLQVLAGLYIIVRGMDNIETGLINTKYHIYWKKVF
ncbi:MAG: hypothetical protein FWF92_11200 [Oscillospiraceae bacterium]|nr:hypothetical protein [Oscillospiraceae bacterium]